MKNFITFFILLFYLPVSAQEIPDDVEAKLLTARAGPNNEITGATTRKLFSDFLKKQRDDIVPLIIRSGPNSTLSENLARAVSDNSEPKDYLIIVTEFLNRVADDEFSVENDKWIVSTLLSPNSEKLEGLIAMNYQLPELNRALHRAMPKVGERQEFIQRVLSGEQKLQTIEFFDSQERQYPSIFSSLYSNNHEPTKVQRETESLQPNSDRERKQQPITQKGYTNGHPMKLQWFSIFSVLVLLLSLFFIVRKYRGK